MLEKVVTGVQYLLLTIMIFVVLQIIFTSEYNTWLLKIPVNVSSGLAVYVMGLLSYSLLSWFKISKAIIVLLYGLAAAALAMNVTVVSIFLY